MMTAQKGVITMLTHIRRVSKNFRRKMKAPTSRVLLQSRSVSSCMPKKMFVFKKYLAWFKIVKPLNLTLKKQSSDCIAGRLYSFVQEGRCLMQRP